MKIKINYKVRANKGRFFSLSAFAQFLPTLEWFHAQLNTHIDYPHFCWHFFDRELIHGACR